MGDCAAALDWFKKALAIWEKVLGPDHPNTKITYSNLAYVYDAIGETAAAQHYRELAGEA